MSHSCSALVPLLSVQVIAGDARSRRQPSRQAGATSGANRPGTGLPLTGALRLRPAVVDNRNAFTPRYYDHAV